MTIHSMACARLIRPRPHSAVRGLWRLSVPLLVGCGLAPDARTQRPPRVPLSVGEIRGVALLADSAQGRATISVHVESDEAIAAYQGGVTYDRDALRLTRATVPAGEHRFVNDVSTEAGGRVRFAGFAVDSLARGAVATLEFEVRDWSALQRLRVSLDVVGDREGGRVAARRLVRDRGVY